MENRQERVLAYTLATMLDHEALDEVFGGSGGKGAQKVCVQITGETRTLDTIVDL